MMAKLSLHLATPKDDTRPVYLTGNFNNWRTDEDQFRLQREGEGNYAFSFPENLDLPHPLEYKYIRGGWENVELDEFGNHTPNRCVNQPSGSVTDVVPRWRKDGLEYNPALLPMPEIITEEFEMPQLGKKRRISILLPHNYHAETQRRYPVIYLQDGQNLFNDHAPYGNWQVNKKLAVLSEQGKGDVIIVAIDHGGSERIAEYTPSYANTRFGTGLGKKYARFMADTLKPYIDKNYRTLSDREHTGIGGSSMGGLISIYAGLMYPEEFSKLMIFSPSLWVTPKIYFEAINFFQPSGKTKIYLYVGGKEGKSTVENVERFKEVLERRGMDGSPIDFELSIDPEGQHNEERWGREFPKALEWLFK
ncbi:MAG: hypothetical protein RLZZ292_487 [Bacteroidota bacterium]|jgi:predicted alpha/beta superfamily hydrolase